MNDGQVFVDDDRRPRRNVGVDVVLDRDGEAVFSSSGFGSVPETTGCPESPPRSGSVDFRLLSSSRLLFVGIVTAL